MRIFCIFILCFMLFFVPSCMLPKQSFPIEPREITYVLQQQPVQQSFITTYQEWIFLASYVLSGILLGICAKSSDKGCKQDSAEKLYKESKKKYSLMVRMARSMSSFFKIFARRGK